MAFCESEALRRGHCCRVVEQVHLLPLLYMFSHGPQAYLPNDRFGPLAASYQHLAPLSLVFVPQRPFSNQKCARLFRSVSHEMISSLTCSIPPIRIHSPVNLVLKAEGLYSKLRPRRRAFRYREVEQKPSLRREATRHHFQPQGAAWRSVKEHLVEL